MPYIGGVGGLESTKAAPPSSTATTATTRRRSCGGTCSSTSMHRPRRKRHQPFTVSNTRMSRRRSPPRRWADERDRTVAVIDARHLVPVLDEPRGPAPGPEPTSRTRPGGPAELEREPCVPSKSILGQSATSQTNWSGNRYRRRSRERDVGGVRAAHRRATQGCFWSRTPRCSVKARPAIARRDRPNLASSPRRCGLAIRRRTLPRFRDGIEQTRLHGGPRPRCEQCRPELGGGEEGFVDGGIGAVEDTFAPGRAGLLRVPSIACAARKVPRRGVRRSRGRPTRAKDPSRSSRRVHPPTSTRSSTSASIDDVDRRVGERQCSPAPCRPCGRAYGSGFFRLAAVLEREVRGHDARAGTPQRTSQVAHTAPDVDVHPGSGPPPADRVIATSVHARGVDDLFRRVPVRPGSSWPRHFSSKRSKRSRSLAHDR